jgi:hypothetical protein
MLLGGLDEHLDDAVLILRVNAHKIGAEERHARVHFHETPLLNKPAL